MPINQTSDAPGFKNGFLRGYSEGYNVGLAEGKAQMVDLSTYASSVSFASIADSEPNALRNFPNINLLQVKNINGLFSSNEAVETIGDVYSPTATTATTAFYKVGSLRSIGIINLPKCTDYYRFCASAWVLEEIGGVVFNADSDNPVTFSCSRMFDGSIKLKQIGGQLNLTNCIGTNLMFNVCTALEHVEFVAGSIHVGIDLSSCGNLDDVSIQSIVDGFADMTGQETVTLTLHADVKAKLTETQIATLTGKNVTIA